MRGSFPLRGIFSTVSLRRRQESRFHIFILSVAKDLFLAQQQILRRLRVLRMTASASRATLAKLGHHRCGLEIDRVPSRSDRDSPIEAASRFAELPADQNTRL